MSSARAPQAIYALWDDIEKLIPRAKLSGIVGDQAHSFGYHLARQQLPASDYSRTLALDKRGAADCASALDITLPADLMLSCTRRLHAAAVNKDPRLKALREFCGTLDGRNTFPWDLHTNSSEGLNSWDDSHLWHIHLSFYRAYADDYAAIAPVAEVLAGVARTASSVQSDLLEDIVSLPGAPKGLTYSQFLDDVAARVAPAVWTADVIPAPTNSDVKSNPRWSPGSFLHYLYENVTKIQKKVDA